MPSTPQNMGRDVVQITQEVFSSMLGLEILENTDVASPDETTPGLMGEISISGSWIGRVQIATSMDVCQHIAAAMFCSSPDEVPDDEVRDALGELTNMIGGNIKNLLAPPVKLGLPAVSESSSADDSNPDDRKVATNQFSLDGRAFTVTVLERLHAHDQDQGVRP